MDEFDLKLTERRNKELLKGIENLTNQTQLVVTSIKNLPDNSEMEKLLKAHIETTERFMAMLKDLPVPELKAPDVVVNSNHQPVVDAVKQMCDQITKNLSDLRTAFENRPTKWSLEFKRDLRGLLTSPIQITAT